MGFFSRTGEQFGKLGGDIKGLGGNIGGSFGALKNSIVYGGGQLGKWIDWSAHWSVKAVRMPVNATSFVFNKFPVTAAIGTALGGAMLVGGFISNRAARKTQNDFATQAAGMQQGNPYQISPQDYAAMQSRMRDSMANGVPSGGLADKVMAAKQAAAAAPEAAKKTADLSQL